MRGLLILLVGVALTVTSVAASSNHGLRLEAVGTLYTMDISGSLQMTCTISWVDGAPFRLDGPVLLTAAHCISRGLRVDERTPTAFTTTSDWLVSFDERLFFGVKPVLVGRERDGYDFAVMLPVEADAAAAWMQEGFKFVNWADVTLGQDVVNVANPMGLGRQLFRGYLTMLQLRRPVEGFSVFWRDHAVAIVPSAGGSSGSLILTENGLVVGVLVGAVVPRSGAEFTIIVPVWRIYQAVAEDRLLKPAGN